MIPLLGTRSAERVPPIRAVLFDMDGTLCIHAHDPLPEFKRRWGIPEREFVFTNLPRLPEAARKEFIELEARLSRESSERPGIRELLHDLLALEIQLAVVTNNSLESANTVLTAHELPIEFVRTREDGAMKPAPDLVQYTLSALELSPEEAILVGDTAADVGAAINAELRACILFAEPWNAGLEQEGPTLVRRVDEVQALRALLTEFGVDLTKSRTGITF